jgi:putative regulator of septum formation
VEGRQPSVRLLGGDDRVRHSRSRAATVLAMTTVLALAGCTSGDGGDPASDDSSSPSASASTPAAAVPAPAPPAVGVCYRISYDEAVAPSNADTPVPCTKGHTSQTFAVGELDLVADGHLLAVDSESVRAQVAKRCPRRLAAYVGATPEQLKLSMLRPVWFTPTIEESDAGAGWYRCDVIAVTGDAKVAKIDRDVSQALAKPAVRDDYAMCGTAQPGAATFSHVLCREDHTWKAISVLDLTDRAAKGSVKGSVAGQTGGYPGVAAVRKAGQDVCAAAARAIASDALDYEWGYEWPTKEQWDAGQTFGRCWAPDPA